VPFWEWVIGEVHRQHPEVIFLAEAFTKPKMMRLLAKVGFAQSYTYFTWRNHKQELTDYVSELTSGEMKEYFTGNFFANTPDILPPILQYGGRPAFIMRAVLAATLSASTASTAATSCARTRPFPARRNTSTRRNTRSRCATGRHPGNIVEIITR
jgi:starch synthase (maltosyl-transferring)